VNHPVQGTFIYCGLFNEPIRISGHTASNGGTIGKAIWQVCY